MIQIIDVSERSKNKYLILTDNEIAFVVYKGDLSKYNLRKGREFSQEELDAFVSEVILPRGKRRSLYLLGAREYSCKGMRDKLRQDGYPDFCINEIMEFLKCNRYIDDERYAKAFIRTYSGNQSVSRLKNNLRQKGISEECIESSLEDLASSGDLPSQEALVRQMLRKKNYKGYNTDRKEYERIFSYLLRKGFSSELIRRCMREDSVE